MRVNGFYGHIQRNRLRSVVMFGGFLVSVQIIAAVALALPLFFLAPKYCPLLDLTAYVSAFGLPVAGAGLILFAGNYFWHLDNVQDLSGFRKVAVHDEPRLWRIIEIQARLVGLPMPAVAVIPSRACNAFAAGVGRTSAVIVVTQGLLEFLDDEQLEAVIAHEIAHVVNGDTGAIAVANAMLSSLLMLSRRNPLRLDKWYKLVLSVIFLPLLVIYLIGGFVAFVGTTMAMLSRYIIASSREFIADAQAVEITKNPAALISPLQVIQGRSSIRGLDPQIDAMMIDGETMGAYASHPPMDERIAILTQLAGSMASTVGRRKDTRHEALKSGFAFGAVPLDPNSSVAQLRSRVHDGSAASAPPDGQGPKGVVARLNAGSDRNVFGMPRGIRTALKYVMIGCVAWVVYANMQLRSMMQQEGKPPAMKTAPAGQLAPSIGHISTEPKPLASSKSGTRAA